MVLPPRYLAQATLFFPGVNSQLYLKLCQALQTDPSVRELPMAEGPMPAQENLARLVLGSRLAAESAAMRAPARFVSSSSGLKIQVEASSAELARQQLEALLAYYDGFVKNTPLSPSGRTRLVVEKQLEAVAQHLRETEVKLSQSSDSSLRQLGDTAIQADPKVMAQVWLNRTEDEAVGRAILDTLEQLREQHPAENLPVSKWLSRWAGAANRLPGANPRLTGKVRKEDLLTRLKLERSYFDTLLKYRSLLLQHSFLRTLESLEKPSYEIIDPPSVEPVSKERTCLWLALTGFLGGFAAAGLWVFRQRE